MERSDGQIQENRYDAEGLRHEMRENGKLLRFVYQNGELLYEEGGDRETASCHLGAGIEAARRGQRTYYYHPDEQLSTALITDETGTIKNQYRYDAFGAGLEVSEELPNRIRYTGQQYDEVTEQYYLRARYYNPILGRFLQEDVYQGDGLNLYAYCRNNPVVYYDPSGYGSSFFFRGDDDYKKGNSIGVPIGDGADIVSFDVHVNNKETTSGSSIYTSFSEELKPALRFTKDGKVIKVKISDLKELENQGVIKIYDVKDAKKILQDQGLRREANDTYENMRKNKEVLIEGEIPADMIKQVPKEQIKGRKC